MKRYLFLEAFYGGSHKQLLDTILAHFDAAEYDLFYLPARKWHWKARTSALHFSQMIPEGHSYEVLFTSSVLNLAELTGMRVDLASCKKIVYFHENQLLYPVQEIKARDCQYGLNQIMSCLAADDIVFNSHFNKSSFLERVDSFLNISTDAKLRGIRAKIEPKCDVIYFPIDFGHFPRRVYVDDAAVPLHLVWPHRWEHDKNCHLLADALTELEGWGIDFRVSITGENFAEVPDCFAQLKEKLGSKIINFGFLSKRDYISCLLDADVVISTADHEFYGVSMLEATYCGCLPVAPNKLVYPEIYPRSCLYNTQCQLVKMLSNWCRNRSAYQRDRERFFQAFALRPHSADHLVNIFLNKICK